MKYLPLISFSFIFVFQAVPVVVQAQEETIPFTDVSKESAAKPDAGWTIEKTLDTAMRPAWHRHLVELHRAADEGDWDALAQIRSYQVNGLGQARDYINP